MLGDGPHVFTDLSVPLVPNMVAPLYPRVTYDMESDYDPPWSTSFVAQKALHNIAAED